MEIFKGIFYLVTILLILVAPIAAVGWIIYRLIKGGSGSNNNSITGN